MNKDNARSMVWVALGAASGALLGGLLSRRHVELPIAPQLRAWQKSLRKEYGPVDAAFFGAKVQSRYEELYARRPRFCRRALRTHLEENILPGVALYQTLLGEGLNPNAALEMIADLNRVVILQEYSRFKPLARLPIFFPLFRWIVRGMMRLNFPPEGWSTEWVEDSSRRVAFNLHSCFYHRVLSYYGVPELTPVFCESDDVMMEAFGPTVRFERTTTIGRGGALCDFCYSPVPPQSSSGSRAI